MTCIVKCWYVEVQCNLYIMHPLRSTNLDENSLLPYGYLILRLNKIRKLSTKKLNCIISSLLGTQKLHCKNER